MSSFEEKSADIMACITKEYGLSQCHGDDLIAYMKALKERYDAPILIPDNQFSWDQLCEALCWVTDLHRLIDCIERYLAKFNGSSFLFIQPNDDETMMARDAIQMRTMQLFERAGARGGFGAQLLAEIGVSAAGLLSDDRTAKKLRNKIAHQARGEYRPLDHWDWLRQTLPLARSYLHWDVKKIKEWMEHAVSDEEQTRREMEEKEDQRKKEEERKREEKLEAKWASQYTWVRMMRLVISLCTIPGSRSKQQAQPT